jgi:dsRNA-specific ribonuclease
LELGLITAREFMLEVIRIELDVDKIAENITNYKEIIAQIFIRNGWGTRPYKIISTSGPDHKKVFTVGLYLNGKLMTQGTAGSKKAAEQKAARLFYLSLQKQNQ